jgi:hypothetical protein
METKMEAEEISGAPIDDSVFAVPRDAQLVSVPELLKTYLPASRSAEASDAATASPQVAAKAEPAPQN